MNRGRNTIVNRLKGPLILCLTPSMEPIFAHAAPDFWSIRSAVAFIQVQASIEGRLRPLPNYFYLPGPKAQAEALRQIEQARLQAAAHPGDEKALRLLALSLGDAGLTLEAVPAEQAAAEGVTITRSLIQQAPSELAFQEMLATLLSTLGAAQIRQGLWERAGGTLHESVEVLRRLLSRRWRLSRRPDLQGQLAVSRHG